MFSSNIEEDKDHETIYKCTQYVLTSIVQAIWYFLQDLRSRESIFSKWRLSFQRKKFLTLIFSLYPLWQTSSNNFVRFHQSFDKYGAISEMNSSTPMRFLKTQIFEEKGYSSNGKSIRPFFLVLSTVTNLKDQIIGENKAF